METEKFLLTFYLQTRLHQEGRPKSNGKQGQIDARVIIWAMKQSWDQLIYENCLLGLQKGPYRESNSPYEVTQTFRIIINNNNNKKNSN